MKVGRIEKIAISTLLTVMFLAAAVLTLPRARAEGTTDIVEITVPVSCSMTGTVTTAHTKSILNAHVEEDIGTTNAKVVCNDNSGYAVYAIGYTDDEYGKTVLTDSTLGSTSDIATGLATMGDISNWAMKLAKAGSSYYPIIAGSTDDNTRQTGDPDFSDYAVVPSEYTKVLYHPSSTDVGTGASGSNFTTTYRAYISRTQLAGTYVGQVKYTLVHPSTEAAPMAPLSPSVAPNNSIVYAPNTSDTQGDMSSLPYTSDNNSAALRAASQTAGAISATANSTTTLVAPNFYREGYGFAGWSTEFDAVATHNANIASNSNETVTIYGPNETISTNPTNGGLDVSSGAILYPVWVASSGTLQEFSCASSNLTPASYDSASGRVSATLSSITALTDARDGNTYAVAKLADGQCWMIENLRLNSEHTTSSEDVALAEGYGNATTSINAGGNNLGKFVGLAGSEDANFADNTTANSLYSIDGTNGTININSNSSYYPGYRLPRYNKNNTNMAPNATNSDGTASLVTSYNANDNHSRWYGYGNYYNWPAAMANTEYYTTYSGTNGSDAADTSICPSNWHLPLGYTSTGELDNQEASSTWRVGGFSYLDRVMGGTGQDQSSTAGSTQSVKLRSFPNNFVYSGYWRGAQADYRSGYSYYWSSSASNGYNAYYLSLNSSHVYPGTDSNRKYYGFTVRCVAGS